MRLRRTLNYHSLKKGRVRQTWNKHNLFNLGRVTKFIPNFIRKTFFQQKWAAKALTRAYHGEHVREGKWERMFSRRLLSVVNMDPEYMAHHDGSEQAAGRGSGKDPYTELDQLPWGGRQSVQNIRGSILKRQDAFDEKEAVIKDYGQDLMENEQLSNRGQTPYMNMTYAPLERRIDVAIHRALFASSTRQARQFVVHGAVKVNGKVMRHPNYLLNPGDMFQVNIDSVLYATGRGKTGQLREPKSWDVTSRKAKVPAEEEAAEAGEEVEAEVEAAEKATEVTADEPTDTEQASKQLRFLSKITKRILADDKYKLKANKKRDLRQFIKEAREAMSKMGRKDAEQMASTDLVSTISDMLKELALQNGKVIEQARQSNAFSAKATDDAEKAAEEASSEKKAASAAAAAPTSTGETESKKKKGPSWQFQLEEAELDAMKKEVKDFEDNPYDPSKPYHTPWQPRPYMSAFAFIPRYLEVNQNVCAAVYLRHPVARRNYAEVPSPFPPHVMQLAFNWYLRRR